VSQSDLPPHLDEHHDDGRYAPVFETTRGRVLCCPGCGRLQVRFGNAVLGLDDEELTEFRAAVAAFDRDAGAAGPHRQDHAVFYAGDTGLGFAFSRAETAELHRLLEGARLLLDLAAVARRPLPPAPRPPGTT